MRSRVKSECECWYANVMEEAFIAISPCRPYLLPLRRTAPVGCRGYCARIGAEADESTILAIFLTDKLSDVPFASLSHLRGASITKVRIVSPHHYFCRLEIEVCD